jgi:hypothetical protein
MPLPPANLGSDAPDSDLSDLTMVDAVPVVPAAPQRDSRVQTKLDPLVTRFIRSFHVLLRAVRLYQRNHPRVNESLESAEGDLRAVLTQVPALSVRIEHHGLIATTRESASNTSLLADPRGEMKVLAAELTAAGVSSLIFLSRTNLGEFSLLAHALDAASRNFARNAAPPDWPDWIAKHQIAGVQINASLQRRDETVLALLMAALPSAAPSEEEASRDTVRTALSFLPLLAAHLDQAQQAAPQDAPRAVRAALSQQETKMLALLSQAAQQDPPLEGDSPSPYLARLADALAIEFVRVEYVAGRLRAGDVHATLAGMEETSGNDGGRDARTEMRVERFWAILPARIIGEVLSGPDAWCLPVSVLRRYLEPLLIAAERKRAEAAGKQARRAVMRFVGCLQHDRESVRRTVAAGLVELADLLPRLWPHPETAGLEPAILSALACERSPAPYVLLASSIEILARMALERRCYGELEKILCDLDDLSKSGSETVQPLANRLTGPQFFLPLLDAALANRSLDPSLPRILMRDPVRLLDRLTVLLNAPDGATFLPAMARLIRATGQPVLRALETDLSSNRRQRIATAIKLLAASSPERLAAALPRTLPGWEWNLQDLAVTELTRQCSPPLRPRLAQAFFDVLSTAHLHVMPALIDFIAMAREESAIPRLVELAAGLTSGNVDIFVRIKAVEALGRLRATSALPQLHDLATTRDGLTYAHPPGLRSAAEEALALLEGRTGGNSLQGPGPDAEKSPFSRARRYQRVALSSPMPASIDGADTGRVRVRAIALGGALLETGSRLSVGDSMRIEIHAGLGRIRSTAVVRNENPEGYGVEFVHMDQEDHDKLRRRLVKLLQ